MARYGMRHWFTPGAASMLSVQRKLLPMPAATSAIEPSATAAHLCTAAAAVPIVFSLILATVTAARCVTTAATCASATAQPCTRAWRESGEGMAAVRGNVRQPGISGGQAMARHRV